MLSVRRFHIYFFFIINVYLFIYFPSLFAVLSRFIYFIIKMFIYLFTGIILNYNDMPYLCLLVLCMRLSLSPQFIFPYLFIRIIE